MNNHRGVKIFVVRVASGEWRTSCVRPVESSALSDVRLSVSLCHVPGMRERQKLKGFRTKFGSFEVLFRLSQHLHRMKFCFLFSVFVVDRLSSENSIYSI
jgi:hypothetical protein